MPNDKIKAFYESIKSNPNIKGVPSDYAVFEAAMKDKAKSEAFFNAVKSNPNIKGLPKDYNAFYSTLNGEPPGKSKPDGSGALSGGLQQPVSQPSSAGQPTGSRAFDPLAKFQQPAAPQPTQRTALSDKELLSVQQEPMPSDRMGVEPLAPPRAPDVTTKQQAEESLKKGEKITGAWRVDELKEAGADKYQPTRSRDIDLQSAIKSTTGKASVSPETMAANEAIRAVEEDYLDFLQQTNPDAAEYKRNEITAIREKSKKDKLNTKEEELLRDFTNAAIAMRDANAEYNMLSVRQSSDVDVFQRQSGPIIAELENVVKQMQSLGINPEGENPPAKIDAYNKLVEKQNSLIGSIENLREQTGFTPEKEDLLFNSAKTISTPDVSAFVGGRYPELEEQEAKRSEKLANRYLEAMAGNWEIGRSFAGAVGKSIIGIAQIPKVAADITGNKEYGWTDELYNSTESFLMSKEGTFDRPEMIGAEYKDLPLSYKLTRLFGEGVGSMATLAAGGAAGGTSKIGQYLATTGAAFLTQEADSYKEARDAGMNEQEAAVAGTSVALVTSMLEGLIPDVKYFEPAPFRKSVIEGMARGVKLGKGAKESFQMAVKNAMDALPASAKQYLVNVPATGGKEAVEELSQQVGGDITKEVVNTMVDNDYQNVWDKDAYTDAMLGGFLVGGGMTALKRPGTKSPVQEDVLLTATERRDDIVPAIEISSPERVAEITSALDKSSEVLSNLEKMPTFDALPRDKKAHVLSELMRKKELEEASKAVGIQDEATAKEIATIDENVKSILDTGFTPAEIEQQKIAAEQERTRPVYTGLSEVELEIKKGLGERIYTDRDIDTMVEEKQIIEDCPPGMTKAEHGARDHMKAGGKWQIVEEFKGKTHKEGGIDIEISGGMVKYGGDGGKKMARGGFWNVLGDIGKFAADRVVGIVDPQLIKASDYDTKFFKNASVMAEAQSDLGPLAKITGAIRKDTPEERMAGMTQEQVDIYNKTAAIAKPLWGAATAVAGAAVPGLGIALGALNTAIPDQGPMQLPANDIPSRGITGNAIAPAQDQQLSQMMQSVANINGVDYGYDQGGNFIPLT